MLALVVVVALLADTIVLEPRMLPVTVPMPGSHTRVPVDPVGVVVMKACVNKASASSSACNKSSNQVTSNTYLLMPSLAFR